MPPSRRSRLRIHEILLLGFALVCAVIVAATEGRPRLVPPVVSYGALATASGGLGAAPSGCGGLVAFAGCR